MGSCATLTRASGTVVIALALSCGPRPHPALRVPLETLRARVRTICIAPVEAGFWLPNHDERMERVATALARTLRRHDHTVVEPGLVGDVLGRVARERGGAYDPHSGQWSQERASAVRRDLRAALARDHACDAVLLPRLVVVRATWANGVAEWDGASQAMGGAWGAYGWVSALSLYVRIDDMQEHELYFSTGGIEVLAHVERGFFSSEGVPVDDGSLLTDDTRIDRAADYALAELWPDRREAELPPPVERWDRARALQEKESSSAP